MNFERLRHLQLHFVLVNLKSRTANKKVVKQECEPTCKQRELVFVMLLWQQQVTQIVKLQIHQHLLPRKCELLRFIAMLIVPNEGKQPHKVAKQSSHLGTVQCYGMQKFKYVENTHGNKCCRIRYWKFEFHGFHCYWISSSHFFMGKVCCRQVGAYIIVGTSCLNGFVPKLLSSTKPTRALRACMAGVCVRWSSSIL